MKTPEVGNLSGRIKECSHTTLHPASMRLVKAMHPDNNNTKHPEGGKKIQPGCVLQAKHAFQLLKLFL